MDTLMHMSRTAPARFAFNFPFPALASRPKCRRAFSEGPASLGNFYARSLPRRHVLPKAIPRAATRHSTTSSRQPLPLTDRLDKLDAEPKAQDVPSFEITYTCKPCLTRSTHRISKHGYEKGTVLTTCPNCKNRHVISDHLGIFSDTNMTIEQLLEERGEAVKKGVLSPDGDIELWDDGTQSSRPNRFGEYPGPGRNKKMLDSRLPEDRGAEGKQE